MSDGLIQELRDKHDAWQKQCDEWIAKAESLGGIDVATIERLRRTVYGEAADTLAANVKALSDLAVENEWLKKHNDGIVVLFEKFHAEKVAAESTLAEIRAENEQLRRALAPFAGAAKCYSADKAFMPDSMEVWRGGECVIHLGDFRAASRSLGLLDGEVRG